jgi:hypothetical protein
MRRVYWKCGSRISCEIVRPDGNKLVNFFVLTLAHIRPIVYRVPLSTRTVMREITYTSPMVVIETAPAASSSLWSHRADTGRLGNDSSLAGRRAR